MQSHIDLYVNEYSIDLGGKGRHAVQTMFNMAHAKGLIGDYDRNFMIQPLSSL
jgi:1,4-dihydroxy-6-naphthoate synthase